MPGWARLGDVHACGAVAASASPDVFANGIQVHRKTDVDNGVHCAVQVQASPDVFANGLPIARCGDNHGGCPCPDPPHPPNPHVSCSEDVFAN